MHWRTLVDDPADGAWNMALDEALLEAHRLGLSGPTLRLYRWATPTLSLGYAQRFTAEQQTRWRAEGASLVRRPTGGRAVVHAHDFTYSVVTSGLPLRITSSYEALSQGVIGALRLLGLEAGLGQGQAHGTRSASCFASATPADLIAAGQKLCGSAQVRRQGAVLQHGTMYLDEAPQWAWLPEQPPVQSLAGLLGRKVSWEMVAEAFMKGFSSAFPGTWESGAITAWERNRALEHQERFRL
ncbi:MAG: lipoate--protein ligase family protein [Candidatus Sericytochromatia bacterium]|nr:lipoate--protein ligase family protein [Candidatus Sericytochromatia bacterium]